MQQIPDIAIHDEQELLNIIAEHEAAAEALLLRIVEIQSDPARLNEAGAAEMHRLWQQCKPHDEARENAWAKIGPLNQQTLYTLPSADKRSGWLRLAFSGWVAQR